MPLYMYRQLVVVETDIPYTRKYTTGQPEILLNATLQVPTASSSREFVCQKEKGAEVLVYLYSVDSWRPPEVHIRERGRCRRTFC
jgi:hypothetical protein